MSSFPATNVTNVYLPSRVGSNRLRQPAETERHGEEQQAIDKCYAKTTTKKKIFEFPVSDTLIAEMIKRDLKQGGR